MVTPMTIRRWTTLGLLPARTTSGGHRRFLRQDVERFAQERGLWRPDADQEGLRILVVDDNLPFADSLAEALSARAGIGEVQVAQSGFEAGVKLRDFSPHVVLLDLMMPGLSGIDVCETIKTDTHTQDIRVFVVTGYPSAENIERALAAGAETCLSKPLSVDDLLPLLGIHE